MFKPVSSSGIGVLSKFAYPREYVYFLIRGNPSSHLFRAVEEGILSVQL
jgi:hypothetical protein